MVSYALHLAEASIACAHLKMSKILVRIYPYPHKSLDTQFFLVAQHVFHTLMEYQERVVIMSQFQRYPSSQQQTEMVSNLGVWAILEMFSICASLFTFQLMIRPYINGQGWSSPCVHP